MNAAQDLLPASVLHATELQNWKWRAKECISETAGWLDLILHVSKIPYAGEHRPKPLAKNPGGCPLLSNLVHSKALSTRKG